MSKRQWLCLLGAWVIVFPFFGITLTLLKGIAFVTGLIIISIAYKIPQEFKEDLQNSDSTFVETNNKDIVQ